MAIDNVLDGVTLYKIHRFTSAGTFTFQVTNPGNFSQDLRFVTTANSTFNGVSSSQGVLTPLAQSYTVVVGSGGRVDIAYPQDKVPNTIPFSKINPIETAATGGGISTITVNGVSYRLHQFTSSGTSSFNVSYIGNYPYSNVIEYLIIGGGGAGSGSFYAPGAGGGGFIEGFTSIENPQNFTIVVGNGGVPNGGNGQSSSAFGLTALGGGGSFQTGASSGGTSSTTTRVEVATPGQGFEGGLRGDTGGRGGGGGAGGPGRDGSNPGLNRGKGGNGRPSSITGSPVYYGAGGGGAMDANIVYYIGQGGFGGGGNAAADYLGSAVQAQAGQVNRGAGGGGGCWSNTPNGGAGGRGVVIVRYRIG